MIMRGFIVGDRILGQSADSHADWCAGYGQIRAYQFVGASAIGKLHLREARPRDDAFAVRSAGVWLAVAVSDGAGSRKQSRYGASFAVEALCEHLLREATGVAPSSEAEPAESPPLADEDDKPTQVEPIPQQTKEIGATGGLLTRLRRRAPAETAPKVEIAHPLPPFDAPSLVTPSDEAATICGTLTWHWQPPAKASTPTSPPTSPTVPLLPTPGPSQEGREAEGTREVSEDEKVEWEKCMRRAFQHTRQGIEQFAHSRNVALRELHCTLLGLLLNTETGVVTVGQIGDGLLAAFHPGLGAQPLVEAPTPGEVGETYVLTQRDWEEYLAVRALTPKEAQGITTFYLMTDGVADDCIYPPPEDIFQRWAGDIDREVRKDEPLPQTTTRLLRWLATYEVKGSWDDRTLVVVLQDAESETQRAKENSTQRC